MAGNPKLDYFTKLKAISFPGGGASDILFKWTVFQAGGFFNLAILISKTNGFAPFIDAGTPTPDWIQGSPFNPTFSPAAKKFTIKLPALKDLKAMLSDPGPEFYLGIYYFAVDVSIGAKWALTYEQRDKSDKITKSVPGGGTDQDWAGAGNLFKLITPHGVLKVSSSSGAGTWV